ncbi:MAG: phosphoribosylanthranilate isomerase [Acidobacteriaceae bacterium]|nr:phosphoribosylanthranilate isomerase [Acidobacteriaceae bacterium]
MIEPAFVIKICGVTCEEDADAALDAGANAIGFNFYPESPRYITPERAYDIASSLPCGCLIAGVFVNAPSSEVNRIAEQVGLEVVQLHGKACEKPTGAYRIWRSLPANLPAPARDDSIEAYLLDSATPKFGGSGETFDWYAVRGFPYRMIVAGGLDASNVAGAIAALQPWGVDACSRLESSPGRKDPVKVREFVAAALKASESLSGQAVTL